MRDWRALVREQTAGAKLSPAEESDVVEELAQHLEDRFTELCQRGTPVGRAEQMVIEELVSAPLDQSLRGFGRRDQPPALGGSGERGFFLGVWQDVRYALRMFRVNPGFTAAAVLTLGLGAGAATAVFSLLDGVVLRPLPYAAPEQLAMLWETNAQKNLQREPVSPVNVVDYRALTSAFTDVAAWWKPEINLSDDAGEPIRVSTVEVSENLFAVLGVSAVRGRTFPQDSTLEGSEAEAVISHELWQSRFGGSEAVVGKSVRLDGFPYTIVGVMPAGFHFPDDTDVWQRLQWPLATHNRGAHFMGAVARLRPGVTTEAANRELAALGDRLGREFPQTNAGWVPKAVALNDDIAGVFRPGLFALFGASGLLLLIACINVANLLLARATGRQSEIAIRSALGATRSRLLRQLLLESSLLAALGAAVGLIVALAAVRGFLAWTPIDIPRAAGVGVNGVVLAFTAGVSVLTALVFGFAPAVMGLRSDLQSALKDISRGSTVRRAGYAQSARHCADRFGCGATIGAGLLIRSVSAL
jgi:predicted permease